MISPKLSASGGSVANDRNDEYSASDQTADETGVATLFVKSGGQLVRVRFEQGGAVERRSRRV